MDNILKNSEFMGTDDLEWFNGPITFMNLQNPLTLKVSSDKKQIKLENHSPFSFEDVKVCLIKDDDMMPVYAFKEMTKRVEAFKEYSLEVPEKTYTVLKKTFDDKDSYYKVIIYDSFYKELKNIIAPNYTFAIVPRKITLQIGTPEWMWNDDALVRAWVWSNEEDGEWVDCKKVSGTEMTCEIPSSKHNILFVRGNTSKLGWGWNTGMTIHNKSVDMNLSQKGFMFALNDNDL